jgi:hypothetical protein
MPIIIAIKPASETMPMIMGMPNTFSQVGAPVRLPEDGIQVFAP